MYCGRREEERRRSWTRSQQARFRGLPQVHQSIESVHQQVHLLRAGARVGGGLELRADARHFLAPLLGALGGDLVQDRDDPLARRFVFGHLPEVVRELFALAAQFAEGVEQGGGARRAARRVGIAHGNTNYNRTRTEYAPGRARASAQDHGCPHTQCPLACALHDTAARATADVAPGGERVGHIGRGGGAHLDRAALLPDRGLPHSLGEHGEHVAGRRLPVREQGDLRRRARDSRHGAPVRAPARLRRAPARRHRRVPLGGRLDAQPEHRETSDRCRRGHAPHGARLGVPQRPATGRALRAASCRRQRSRSGFPAAADAGVAAALLHRPRYRALPPHDARLGAGGRDAGAFLRDGRQPRRVLRQPLLGVSAAGPHRGQAAHPLFEHRDRPAADSLEPNAPPAEVSTRVAALVVLSVTWAFAAAAQQRDTTARPPQPTDSLKVYTLPPAVVSVTRANPPINRIPQAVQLVEKSEISRARPTWGLDEALATVPGVYAANRYNFSLDQRISIRGFGARSAFAVRGIKVLLDGIPQTLPDGQGQLTNVELGAADRIEVLRGSSSALFGNASGGVISIWSDPAAPRQVVQEIRFTGGTFDRHDLNIFNPYSDRTWYKWATSTQFRAGSGSGLVTLSQLAYNGERQHSRADIRNLNGRFHFPLADAWSLAVVADYGNDPRADNPGSLTAQEMAANPDSAAARNITLRAGKDVWQAQGGATLRHTFAAGGEATLTLFGLRRDLKNPTTFAYIDLSRSAYGARFSLTRLARLDGDEARITAGFDLQRQRDDRLNFGNSAGRPDSSVRTLDQLEHVTEVGPFGQL